MSLSLNKQHARTSHPENESRKTDPDHHKDKPHKKNHHILLLKEELVKMRNFLNEELPEISKLVPQRKFARESSAAHLQSTDDLAKIVTLNRQLFQEKQKLQEQLIKQKCLKRELSRSLKKHGQMLDSLYSTSIKQLNQHEKAKNLSRKKSAQTEINGTVSKPSQSKISEKYQRFPSSVEKMRIRSRQSEVMLTETSICKKLESNQKDKGLRQTAPCYSTSEQEMISNLQEVANLQKKMQELMRESQRTENRTKKLQLRNQMERVANRLHCLKQSLSRVV